MRDFKLKKSLISKILESYECVCYLFVRCFTLVKIIEKIVYPINLTAFKNTTCIFANKYFMFLLAIVKTTYRSRKSYLKRGYPLVFQQ